MTHTNMYFCSLLQFRCKTSSQHLQPLRSGSKSERFDFCFSFCGIHVAKLTCALAQVRAQSRGRGWAANEDILLVNAWPMNKASHRDLPHLKQSDESFTLVILMVTMSNNIREPHRPAPAPYPVSCYSIQYQQQINNVKLFLNKEWFFHNTHVSAVIS